MTKFTRRLVPDRTYEAAYPGVVAWPAFWVEPSGVVEVALRRFTYSEASTCPNGLRGHTASTSLGRMEERRTAAGYLDAIPAEEYFGDRRWPTSCAACDYVFSSDDSWQVSSVAVYRRPDTGEEWPDRVLPVGAMLDGHWHPQKGPDGLALVVVLPPEPSSDGDTRGHWWHVDGPSRNNGVPGPGWTRTGDPRALPPTVDVNPSILTADYHGYLRHGVLTDPV